MPMRLADRLLDVAHRRFVGRAEECRLFDQALAAEELPFFVLHVHGPGGVGKTSLLREYRYRAGQAGVPVAWLDGRTIDPHPGAFLEVLRQALQLDAGADPIEALAAAPGRYVLLVDTFELLGPLERWLRQGFLLQLTDNVLVVLAGRTALAPFWTMEPGWRELIRSIALRNFSADDGRAYLAGAGLPEAQHAAVLGFTYGHPLALSLVAEVYGQRPGTQFSPQSDPDVIKTLLDRFVMKVPSPAHRTALEACAMVHYTTEPLLAEMVEAGDVHDLFEWLRGLSFVDSSPFGLYPHDLAREALCADLRWRNPDWYAELHDRARRYFNRRLEQTTGRDQQRVLMDFVYLHRENPVFKPFLDWQETGSTLPEPLTEAARPHLLGMVARHEGDASAEIARYWFGRQPEGVLVFHDDDGAPAGFLLQLDLERASAADRAADPAVEAACGYLDRKAPLRPGERATYFRFWMDAESYQGVSSTQSLLFLKISQHNLTASDLAFSFFPCADGDFWGPFFSYIEFDRIEAAGFAVEGRRYAVFGHDWRAVPKTLWLDHLAQRELSTSEEPPPPAAPSETLLLVLSDDAFREAVRDALRDYARPHRLRDNPLLRSRLIAEATGADADEADRIETLRQLLADAAGLLQSAPRQERLFRALDRAYFRPAASQEQAAELLDLPYSTFRRHLKAGLDEVTAQLWRREIGGA